MVGFSDSSHKLSQLDFVIAGGGSGFITRMLCQPLDVLKIRFQLQVEPILKSNISKYQSVVHATNLIIKEEGVKALWKGHVPAQLLSISYGVAQFWSFEVLTKQVSTFNLSPSFSPMINFTCGALAGCYATLASFPFDVVRTRLVAQSENHKVYSGILQAFTSILKNEGFFVLYRGIWPTFIQVAPHAGAQFMCYKLFDSIYKYLVNSQNTTLTSSLVSGSLAGLFAKTVVYPFDLAKKRLQIQGFEQGRVEFGQFFKCRGLNDCLIRIYKVEGLSGLFKGLSPSLIKAVVTTALHFSSYELICKSLARRKE
ncbi:mitochondrial thiamine pyrophosphate carrier [Tribolium madens]|uniref:mitochondrial thiamine pyrophosphate carrier n=1 Tax=Tribolium madens TaxID=41895 RepID=UPI001CF757DC|nr:mitochondrial thiamine pyrophosphate carrier [Tribolium madens]